MIGAYLLDYLKKSGLLAQISKVEKSKGPKDKVKRTADKEMLKAVLGRNWGSLIHMITLHTLYWRMRIDVFEDNVKEDGIWELE